MQSIQMSYQEHFISLLSSLNFYTLLNTNYRVNVNELILLHPHFRMTSKLQKRKLKLRIVPRV